MLISTVLVLAMIVPGLALFYGGLVRAKNMVSILSQVFVVTAIGMVMWLLVGYSLAFTDGGVLNRFVGGLEQGSSSTASTPRRWWRPSPSAPPFPNWCSSPSR